MSGPAEGATDILVIRCGGESAERALGCAGAGQVASKGSYLLAQLLEEHSAMGAVVAREVEVRTSCAPNSALPHLRLWLTD